MRLFTNNASTTLASPISNVALSMTVATGDGAKFPSPTGGDYFMATLCRIAAGEELDIEIVKCTARSGDILTIQRGQEGTTAVAHSSGDLVGLRVTAGAMNEHETAINSKQATLVSGTNIKTVNGNSLLGSGDLVIASGGASLVLEDRTSNTMLVDADKGKFINFTSGTFTQTFGTLTANWYAYLKNEGTGEITIPASDGRTNWVMYANELRLFRWNGTALTSEIIHPFYATFTTSGSFIKPPGYSLFSGLLWGAGASGSASRYAAQSTVFRGAGAGACHPFNVAASALSNSTSVVIGSGGASVSATSLNFSNGSDGGNSTFSSFTGYGGSAYYSAGSGVLSKSTGDKNSAGAPNPGFLLANESELSVRTTDSYFGGGYGGATNTNSGTINQIAARGGHSYYGAAGSTGNYGDNTYHTTSGAAGNSVYGGTAGQGVGCNNSGPSFFALNKGTSTFGGTGGNADFGTGARVGQDGGVRGGGGGAAWSTNNTSAVSGAGGRGELQIWGVV